MLDIMLKNGRKVNLSKIDDLHLASIIHDTTFQHMRDLSEAYRALGWLRTAAEQYRAQKAINEMDAEYLTRLAALTKEQERRKE